MVLEQWKLKVTDSMFIGVPFHIFHFRLTSRTGKNWRIFMKLL